MKKIFLLSFLCLILCGCTNSNNNKLVLVTEAGFAPYEYYDNGEITGIDIEIGKQIAKSMNKELVVKDVSFDSIVNELNSGKADFAAAGFSITPERAKEVDFSIEYVVSNQVIVVPNNSIIKSGKDLDGKKIAVQLGSTADFYMQKHYKNVNLLEQKKYLSMMEDLKAGKVDAIIMDEIPAKTLINGNSSLKMVDGYLFTDKYGMAVKKGNNELLKEINKVLQKLIDEGKIEEYTIKYSE